MPSLHDLTYPALEKLFACDALHHSHARRLWRLLHRELAGELIEENLPEDFLPPLVRWLRAQVFATRDHSPRYTMDVPAVASVIASVDGLTRKYLLRLGDGQEIETVLMAYTGRHTVCVSTQAGCAMGCVFCATGQMGFVRHLRAGEIVAQILHVQRILRAEEQPGLRNLVLMGMGEPLHNYEHVMSALEIITDTRGLNIGPGRISISTVGVVPGILRLAEERRPYNLAVSLHGASEAERSALVPVSQRWPLMELIAACRTYCAQTEKRIFFEWTLVAGINDSAETACRLTKLLNGVDAHINLIPLNPTGGFDGKPTNGVGVDAFQEILQKAGYPCTVRQRRGIDVAAGCGQLRARKAKRETTVVR